MTANTANMDVPSNPPSDILYISETQMTPIETSKIKTEPSKNLNVSCDIIVIDSDSDSNDSIVNLIPETPSSTEKANLPPYAQSVPETPPTDDEQNNDSGNQISKYFIQSFRIEMSQSIISIICLMSDISVGNFDSDCESESQSPIFMIKKNIEKSQYKKAG